MEFEDYYSHKFEIALAIIGAIIGTIKFVTGTFSDWYAEYNLEPTGLITGIISVVIYLLPFLLSLFIGGGCGLVVGGVAGIVIKKLCKAIYNSFVMLVNGLSANTNVRKKSKRIKKTSVSINKSINRLEELKKLEINRESIIRTNKLCKLISHVSDDENIIRCLETVTDKMSIVEEINNIEQGIIQLAEEYKAVGNVDKCIYYLKILESNDNIIDVDEIKKDCSELIKTNKQQNQVIKRWTMFAFAILIVILIVAAVNYINDKPYRELSELINNQTLTSEMLERNNKYNVGSYYEYLHTDKGYSFLASELTKLHRENDIDKAMWLLCVQPDCIDGINICASNEFINWVVDYSKENGTAKNDSKQNTIFSINGYDITMR